jgi:UDP-2,3-diacylglucosamine pyrophosphatase LpxH
MREIKTALAMSDLHLGRDLSYLYSRNSGFQKNRQALLDLLAKLGPQDELILNGDLLELSMVGLDEAYHEIKEFFILISEVPPVKRVVYIPGNHDHHFWRELAEQVCVNGRISQGMLPPSHKEYPSCFVDKYFSSFDRNLPCKIVLADLWPKDKPPVEIVVKYPHHLIKVSTNKEQWRYYLFTHGHFLEDMFTPVNYLIEPARLDELEAFNNIWIEAFDYDFGRSGRLMDRVQDLVKKVERGDKEAKQEIKKILDEIYLNCVKKLKLSWSRKLGLYLIKSLVGSLVKEIPLEKRSGLFRAAIDESLRAKIEDYIKKYITERYRKGMATKYNFPSDQDIPIPFTFVFGHTHRPAAEENQESIKIDDAIFPLANTGGWLRIDGTGAANGENAGILVIDRKGARWESLKGNLE